MLWLTRCKGSIIKFGSTAPSKIETHSARAKASTKLFNAGSTSCRKRTERITIEMLNNARLLSWNPMGRVTR